MGLMEEVSGEKTVRKGNLLKKNQKERKKIKWVKEKQIDRMSPPRE